MIFKKLRLQRYLSLDCGNSFTVYSDFKFRQIRVKYNFCKYFDVKKLPKYCNFLILVFEIGPQLVTIESRKI